MKLTKPALLLSACFLLAACGKDTNTNNANTKSNVSSTTTTTTTTNNTATATSTPQPTPQANTSPANRKLSDDTNSKPEDAAKGLFNAWGRNDREAAKQYASDAAIAKLFKGGHDTSGMTSQGCSEEPGGFNCAYTYDGGALIMHVKGSASAGYRVETIEYIAD
jgi:hypothetical protein